MFQLKVEQKVFEVGKVKIGGIPGERPTVLIGSIFYAREKIVSNYERGEFDKEKAEAYIKIQEEYSDKTGNPHMVDVGGSTNEAIVKFLDFASKVTDAPILIGGASPNVRIAGLNYAKEVGIKNPIIYNSILPEHKKEELEKIKEHSVKTVVLLGFNPKDFTSTGKAKTIKNLLSIVQKAGVTQPMIDTAVIDIPSLGLASKALFELKNELGLPVGCGPHNAIGTWLGLKTKMGAQARYPCVASANALPVVFGADFILYGPIEYANYIFPAIALIDAALAQLIIELRKPINRSHPLFKIA
ncbi:tetrahydromethanopterin S-methyltransferase subunit H [Candidatus Bathyarchaeota archaeon]|nr:tetrahydromethanopterin S-methyltransferase subunit H [Candidatus Bathyarchaeota archaeon]